MTQWKISSQDFIRDAFTPQIGVLCSPAAQEVCNKNNLTFAELLEPFCKVNSEIQYKDPNGSVVSVRNLKISLVDVNTRPLQPAVARKYLNASVSDASTPRFVSVDICDNQLEIPSNSPWFESWRDTFLRVQYPADHEFTKHFIACILVVSSTDRNPVDTMVQLSETLNQMQAASLTKLPKWFNNNILRYHVILHETLGKEEIGVKDIYEAMKISYGNDKCFLLKTNSQTPNTIVEQLPDPWSQFIVNRIDLNDDVNYKVTPESSPKSDRSMQESLELGQEVNESGTTLTYHPLSPDTDKPLVVDESENSNQERKQESPVLHGSHLSTEDVEQLKILVHDFCTKVLVPYIERQIHQISDFVANKKGVSKSIFSATKRWFTPNKPTSNSATINTLTYPPNAPELQIRRLGDLYFMFGHYSMAYQVYHAAKRDYMADQAWLYYAGALEMAALSAFMAGESTRKTFDYMEESINTYLNTCKMAQFATRATLLSSECLKSHTMYGEAAHQLIRMTSEESDLRSALLLEQASYCFLLCVKPYMVRKYSFHMVLAGHRYSKAAQRKHSLRCYKQAYQIYERKGWNLAEDHIQYTIGKQANTLNELSEAVQSYAKLLTGDSKQSPQQQAMFLKEYLTVHSELLKQQKNSISQVLPLPIIQSDTIKVLVGPAPPLRTPGRVPAIGISFENDEELVPPEKWNKLEEMLVQEAQGSLPMIFKPVVTLFTKDTNNAHPIAVIGEPIQVSVQLGNPLQILLHLKDIYLLSSFKDKDNKLILNEDLTGDSEKYMKIHHIKSVVLQANSTQEIVLIITPLNVGQIIIKGICYSLVNNSDTHIELKGKQSFNIKSRKDKSNSRLEITVVPSAPCLQVNFGELNGELLRNELQQISVELRNTGSIPLHNIHMATSMPHLLSSWEFTKQYSKESSEPTNLDANGTKERERRKKHVSYVPLPNNILEPGKHYDVLIWMKAPEVIGPAIIDLLIYYESIDNTSIPRYRLVRHIWQLSIQESMKVEVFALQSNNTKIVEQAALTVKATNLNKIHHAILTEISLVKVALLSPNWKFIPTLISPHDIKLEAQESVYFFLKSRRHVSEESNYSEISFQSNTAIVQYPNKAYLDFAKRNEQNGINVFDNVDEENQEHHDATLILRWQAFVSDSIGQKRVISGQHHVPVDINTNELKPVEDSQALCASYSTIQDSNTIPGEKHIMYNFSHPPVVQHNFRINKLCIVPIKLILHSVADKPLTVKINILGSNSGQTLTNRSPLFCPFSSKHFRFTKTGSIMRTINALSSDSFNLSVAALCPGTFDLGSQVQIWCYASDQPESAILQTCRVQSSLVITNNYA